jgi:hypothetical protein
VKPNLGIRKHSGREKSRVFAPVDDQLLRKGEVLNGSLEDPADFRAWHFSR